MSPSSGSVFVSAGEVSGDHYLARVYERLRSAGYTGRVYGLCGDASRGAGVEGLWRAERLQLLGITEVLGSLPDIFRLLGEMAREIVSANPAAIVCVDSPDFHLPLIRRIRRQGYRGRIFYLSPPSVWAWRSYRVRDLAAHVDECLPLFKFEHDYLINAGCNSLWIGHPLVEEFMGLSVDVGQVRADVRKFGEGEAAPVPEKPEKIVALLPGSRRSEVEQLYPIMGEICAPLKARGYTPVFSVAPGLSEHASRALLSHLERDGRYYYTGAGRNLMAAAEIVLGSSGTATAEALLLGRYMVVLYKLRKMTGFIGKILLRGVMFAIPNLLAGEMFFPELIQERATPQAAERAAFEWLDLPDDERAARTAEMTRLAGLMGDGRVYDFWAERILRFICD